MQISKFTKKVDSNEDYHSDPSISSSGLKVIADRSVEYYLNRPPFKTTDAMELGTAIHEKLLFPDQFDDQYFELPKLDLRKKADKEIAAELKEKNKGKITLTTTQMDAINGIYRKRFKRKLMFKSIWTATSKKFRIMAKSMAFPFVSVPTAWMIVKGGSATSNHVRTTNRTNFVVKFMIVIIMFKHIFIRFARGLIPHGLDSSP